MDDDLDACAASLESCGCAALPVPAAVADEHERGFAAAAAALQLACLANHPDAIPAEADSASASGLHRAGVLSQYNVCREGLIFSNGTILSLGIDGFERAMRDFFRCALGVCTSVLAALERRLELADGWFDSSLGPIASSSQWHIKRYRPDTAPPQKITADGKHVLLPVHSDPSLISIVVQDVQGTSPGARGLEYLDPRTSEWHDVPAHGHAVATVFVGSILARITGGQYPACRHRVSAPEARPRPISADLSRPRPVADLGQPQPTSFGLTRASPLALCVVQVAHAEPQSLGTRVVATFFFRPAPQAVLRAPPSSLLHGRVVKPMTCAAQRTRPPVCTRACDRRDGHARAPLPTKPLAAGAGRDRPRLAEIGRGRASGAQTSPLSPHRAPPAPAPPLDVRTARFPPARRVAIFGRLARLRNGAVR